MCTQDITRFSCGADPNCDAFTFTQPTLVSFQRGPDAPAGDLYISASTCGDPTKFKPPSTVGAENKGAYPYCTGTCDPPTGSATFEYQYCPCYAYGVVHNISNTTLGTAQAACDADATCAAFDVDTTKDEATAPDAPVRLARLCVPVQYHRA